MQRIHHQSTLPLGLEVSSFGASHVKFLLTPFVAQDSGIVNKLLSANYGNSVTTWADTLAARIKTGTYKASAPSWISCSSTTAKLKRDVLYDLSLRPRAIAALQCPLVWGQESNAFDCSHVLSYTAGSDLCTSSYYTNAVPVIETQIAKQGYRLAAWLNVLFDGSTRLP